MRMIEVARQTAFAAGVVLLSTAVAAAMGGNHPPGAISEIRTDWPYGLVETIKFDARVQGVWVNANDYFYYAGDAKALNRFIAHYAKVDDTPLKVVLHAGEAPKIGPIGEEPRTRFDWKLNVIRRGWGEPVDPRRPDNIPGYVVTLHVWLSDHITLDQLQIPKHVDVVSAGDIEEFINRRKTNLGRP